MLSLQQQMKQLGDDGGTAFLRVCFQGCVGRAHNQLMTRGVYSVLYELFWLLWSLTLLAPMQSSMYACPDQSLPSCHTKAAAMIAAKIAGVQHRAWVCSSAQWQHMRLSLAALLWAQLLTLQGGRVSAPQLSIQLNIRM